MEGTFEPDLEKFLELAWQRENSMCKGPGTCLAQCEEQQQCQGEWNRVSKGRGGEGERREVVEQIVQGLLGQREDLSFSPE